MLGARLAASGSAGCSGFCFSDRNFSITDYQGRGVGTQVDVEGDSGDGGDKREEDVLRKHLDDWLRSW
jgi:hypothetical protein